MEVFGWSSRDAPDAGKMLSAFRRRSKVDPIESKDPAGIRAIMILSPPSGFTPGRCVGLARDAEFGFVYEVSVVGFPGWGGLDEIRGTIGGIEWAFPWDSTAGEAHEAFPTKYRDAVRITGGTILDQDDQDLTQYQTGRFFLAFREEPSRFSIEDQSSEVVRVRSREVPFVSAPTVRNVWSIADVTVPSPIAVGSLGFAGYCPGLGLTIMSLEPRVFTVTESAE